MLAGPAIYQTQYASALRCTCVSCASTLRMSRDGQAKACGGKCRRSSASQDQNKSSRSCQGARKYCCTQRMHESLSHRATSESMPCAPDCQHLMCPDAKCLPSLFVPGLSASDSSIDLVICERLALLLAGHRIPSVPFHTVAEHSDR